MKIKTNGETITVYFLAKELDTTVAQIIQAVKRQCPKHPKLEILDPNSVLGPHLAEVLRHTVPRAQAIPTDRNDVHWDMR